MKYAVLSMDVEDWYHLDYLDRSRCDCSRSLLDGLDVYRELLDAEGAPSSFFVLGELAAALRTELRQLAADGHDIGSHGWNHIRPLTLTPQAFAADLRQARDAIEDALGQSVPGYRAPCFSLDRERLDLVWEAGHLYDSSRITFGAHALYGDINMQGYERVQPHVYRRESCVEFEVSTLDVAGRTIPVAGGGYLRIIPWVVMQPLLRRYLAGHDLYVLYIHPFELSPQPLPPLPAGMSRLTRFRMAHGRTEVAGRLRRLLALLRDQGFVLTTFAALYRQAIDAEGAPAALRS
jgi:polysaccharide deacetylase family protein (PEP-CTERM system associated)